MTVSVILRGLNCSKRNRLLRDGVCRSASIFCVAVLAANLCSYGEAIADPVGARARYSRHNSSKAESVLMVRADQGHPAAETNLGYMYEKGVGVPQDFVAAAKWMQRAADQGYPPAQFLLGLMYDNGHGVKSDYLQAEVWLDLAAARADYKQRDYWTSVRNGVAGKLTIAELAEAQKRAFEWKPSYTR